MLSLARNTLKRVPSFQEILDHASSAFTMSKEDMYVASTTPISHRSN